MPFKPGQSGNPLGQIRAKPFREALMMEIALAENGEETPAKPGSLRYAARQLITRAGSSIQDLKELADRTDGKVPQGIVGGDEDDAPLRIETIERVIVRPKA